MPAGRPTKYESDYHPDKARKFCLLGMTNEELADAFDISLATLHNWKNKYPEFLDAITRGKEDADAEVAEALRHRAIGYSHAEEKVFNNNGEILTYQTIRHYPPDPQAASLWLRNRQPAKWRDKQEIRAEIDAKLEINIISYADIETE